MLSLLVRTNSKESLKNNQKILSLGQQYVSSWQKNFREFIVILWTSFLQSEQLNLSKNEETMEYRL